jgi:hypothetical protein
MGRPPGWREELTRAEWCRGLERGPKAVHRTGSPLDSAVVENVVLVGLWVAQHNDSALKLPARKCTRRDVWSMSWSWSPPATHFYALRERRSASSAC